MSLPEGMPPIPEGAVMHYTDAPSIQIAMQNPSPLCGADLSPTADDPDAIIGLTPIKEAVNCEACQTLLNAPPREGITPLTFGSPTVGHKDTCDEQDCALNSIIGIRGVDVEGETYIHRGDVLDLIGSLWTGTHNISHKAEQEEDDDAQQKSAFYHLLAQGINMVGSILHAQTQPQNAIDVTVPDDLESLLAGNWSADKPAAESPIDRMIREATEAAQAKKADATQEDNQ